MKLRFCALGVFAASYAAAQNSVLYVNQLSNDIVYSSPTGRILFSCPSGGGQFANRIGAMNPSTGAVSSSMVAGSEPSKLALSENGIDLYSGFLGAGTYRRYDAASMTSGATYALGSDNHGPYFVEDIEVMPGSPDTVAVSRRNIGFSPRHEGVGIYTDGVLRPLTTADHTGSNVIEFGSSASRLYGYNNETTEYGFRKMSVTDQGVVTVEVIRNAIQGFGLDFVYADGLAIASSGRAIQAETGVLVGTFSASGPVAVDVTVRRAFFLTGSGASSSVKVFDLDSYVMLGSIPLGQANGQGTSLVRWGSNGLAFRTPGQIVLVQNSLVPEMSSSITLAFGALALFRRRKSFKHSRVSANCS